MKQNIKYIVIFVIVSIILESSIFLYNNIVKDLFEKYHFINNEVKSVEIANFNFSAIEDEYYDIMELKVPKEMIIYNVKLSFKEQIDNSLYVRIVTDYGEKLLLKSNYPATEFKTYYKSGINTANLKLIFPKNTIQIEDISSVQLNTNLNYMPTTKFSIFRCICLFFVFLTSYLIFKNKGKICNWINNLKLESFFVTLIIAFGVIYTFVNVPLVRYDEHAHFWRAYELSQGELRTNPQNTFPKSIINLFFRNDGTYPNREFNYDTLINQLNQKLSPNEKISFPVGASGGYSIINYLATTVGVFIARNLYLNPIWIFYIGRLFNVFTYSLLSYFAIKLVPSRKMKKIIGIIALFPMSINLAASFSPDTIINGFTLLSISYALKLKFDDKIKKISMKQIALFSIFALIPTICKIVYIFLFGFLFFIPKEKFAKKNSRLLYFLLQFLIIILLYFIFNIVLKGNGQVPIDKNPIEQIIYCVSDPIRVVKIFIYTLTTYSTDYLTELVGGWNTPTILSIILSIILLIVAMEDDKESLKYSFTKKERIALLIIAILEIISVFLALYIDWSVAQTQYVMGIQGRYFIPILPILLLAIKCNVFKINITNKRIKYFILIISIYIVTIIYSILTFMK